MPLGPGSRLDGYELIQPLGAGGMGEVWLAKDVRLERKVALKLLPPELTRDPTRVSRFEQEARAASALNHPNVCHIYALGQTDEGQQYIAMEYVEGETLRQRLSTSRLTIRESLDTAVQIAAALTAAHAAGIVHRDIKPENVMSRPDGLVKVLDFGLAKLALVSAGAGGAGDAATVLKTEVGMVVGTAAYMSPEQARGDAVDPRTDIWSLGVLLYEAVAGRAPFAAPSSTEVLAAILDRDPPPLARYEPDAPGELQRILTKALRKDRTQRFQTMQDLLLDIEALRDDLRTSARSGSGTVTRAATATAQPAPGGSAHLPAVRPRRRLVVGCRSSRTRRHRCDTLVVDRAKPGAASERVRQRVRSAQPHAPDVRRGAADRRHVFARRALHCVRVRPRRQLRYLGAAGCRRRRRADHEGAGG